MLADQFIAQFSHFLNELRVRSLAKNSIGNLAVIYKLSTYEDIFDCIVEMLDRVDLPLNNCELRKHDLA